ncbi:unnamed protein product [Adineta steineri]|nr:unnamed protein product [Adineta steineri]
MKFDAHELVEAGGFLGPFSFSLFIIFIVFICISMFISIINDSFRHVRKNISNDNEDIFLFMGKKILYWIGWEKSMKEEQANMITDLEYVDPIEHFPEKIDQLLNALNRLYTNQNN